MAPSGALTTIKLETSSITSPGALTLDFTGIERIDETSSGAGSTLTVTGTVRYDIINFTPTAAGAGSFVRLGLGGSPQFTYTGVGGSITVDGGSGGFDELGIAAGPGNDLIDANQTSATSLSVALALAPAVAGFTQVFTVTSLEAARIEAGAGDNVIRVTVADALVATPASSLRFTVDGGEPNASDRLNVVDDGLGDTDIYRKGTDDRSARSPFGRLRPGRVHHVEFAYVTPLDDITGGTGTDGLGRFVFFKHDPFENNNSLANATHLGAATTINVDRRSIRGPTPLQSARRRGLVPGRGRETGTLDFQVFFRQIGTWPTAGPACPATAISTSACSTRPATSFVHQTRHQRQRAGPHSGRAGPDLLPPVVGAGRRRQQLHDDDHQRPAAGAVRSGTAGQPGGRPAAGQQRHGPLADRQHHPRQHAHALLPPGRRHLPQRPAGQRHAGQRRRTK